MLPHDYLKSIFETTSRIGFKAGTDVNVDALGKLYKGRIQSMASNLAPTLIRHNIDAFFAISGAIRIGRAKFHKTNNGAAALAGQGILMNGYTEAFERHGINAVGPLLETHAALENKNTRQKARETIDSCIENKLLPLINGNDPLEIRENKDNDGLAALFGIQIFEADAMIYLSNHALHTADPSKDRNAELIRTVDNVDDVIDMAQDTSSVGGTGGMLSKLRSFSDLTQAGIPVALLDATQEDCIQRAIDGDSTLKATIFMPQELAVV